MIKAALIGLGYWGPKLLRNLSQSPDYLVKRVCDRHPEHFHAVKQFALASTFETTPDFIFADPGIDLVVIATQAHSHFELAKQALESGKHVLVEKPFTHDLASSVELVRIAQRQSRRIFVNHIHLFSDDYLIFRDRVRTLKENSGGLWKANRSDFGRFVKDCGILSHLMYHDLYLVDDLFGFDNLSVVCAGKAQILSPFQTDFASVTLKAPRQTQIHLMADMTSASKIRQVSFSCREGGVVWNELSPSDKVSFYRKSFRSDENQKLSYFDDGVEILSFETPAEEPLRKMVQHVAHCLVTGEASAIDSCRALAVMEFLDKIERACVSTN